MFDDTRWEVIEGDDNDCTVRMRVSPQARIKCPELPEFWEARAITVVDREARKRVLLTSLHERRRYKEPTEVSFIRAFHLIQFELHWAAVTRSYGKLPASMKHLRERMVSPRWPG